MMNSFPQSSHMSIVNFEFIQPKIVSSPLRTSPSSNVSLSSSPSAPTFPMNLHAMLTDSDELGFRDIVRWLPGGTAFKVLDPAAFLSEIMPRYFSHQTKYKSFQRQLNIYGFQRVHHGPHKGGYAHTYCIQGLPELCEKIRRVTSPVSNNEVKKTVPIRPRLQRAISFDTEPSPTNTSSLNSNTFANEQYKSTPVDMSFPNFVDSSFSSTMTPCHNLSSNLNPASSAVVRIHDDHPQDHVGDVVLDEDDMAYFKDLFKPGDDLDDEKDLLQNLLMDIDVSNKVIANDNYTKCTNGVPPVNATVTTKEQEAATAVSPLVTGAFSDHNFPHKLYRMLVHSETLPEFRYIVSWNPDGRSFSVHCKKRFVDTILANYFDQTQYASFRRQLNMYNFTRESMRTYSHPNFLRGRRDLLDNITRKCVSNGGSTD